ncbi:MAG: peptidoglycan DD-metalloendopeptidase family protein [Coriobacteriaceae bacterium]|jgi:murein DD-endopeptidase MepM/ murein hydrolase activator NlpD|nr:peptidoglycan DD-metalloendopeptidase family protein [Coriobacteriaceae bacterium]
MNAINIHRTLLSARNLGPAVLAAILALALLFWLPPLDVAHAVTSADKFAEAEDILQRIDVLQTDLNAAQDAYDQAMAEHEIATAAMNDAQKRVDAALARIKQLQDRLAERASDLYRNGNTSLSFIEVLFGAKSFEDFLTSWDMLNKIGSQDAALVQETKDARAEAEAARQEAERQKSIAADKMAQAKALKEQILATQATLKAEAQKITAEAMELQAQEELEAERARQAAAAAEALQRQLESNRPAGGAGMSVISGSGIFTHPCPNSTVSSTFGYRTFDNAFHLGVDFAAAQGTPYYAADDGTVIYATYDGGYNGGAGNWIVISHGDGKVTKYMHSSAVYVSVGERVTRGQNIGAVGNTGNSFGAHLHFQVEVNGVAVDPMIFI